MPRTDVDVEVRFDCESGRAEGTLEGAIGGVGPHVQDKLE